MPTQGRRARARPAAGEQTGFFGQTLPSGHILVDLLLSQRGLLVLTPVLAAAGVGGLLLWRRGLRAEAVLIASLVVVELVWNAGRHPYTFALGGWSPGPRFLIPLLPFLAWALAPALRRAPATVSALALVSAGAMAVATAAEPLLQDDDTHHWIARIVDGNFAATIVSLSGVGPRLDRDRPVLPLRRGRDRRRGPRDTAPVTRVDLLTALGAVVAWIVVEHGAPELLRVDRLVHQS